MPALSGLGHAARHPSAPQTAAGTPGAARPRRGISSPTGRPGSGTGGTARIVNREAALPAGREGTGKRAGPVGLRGTAGESGTEGGRNSGDGDRPPGSAGFTKREGAGLGSATDGHPCRRGAFVKGGHSAPRVRVSGSSGILRAIPGPWCPPEPFRSRGARGAAACPNPPARRLPRCRQSRLAAWPRQGPVLAGLGDAGGQPGRREPAAAGGTNLDILSE